MLFNSYIFVLVFLPITLIGYFMLNKINQNTISKIFLIVMSLYFYAYFNYSYLLIILTSILFNYVIGKLLHKITNKNYRIICLIMGLVFNIGVLFYFKYYDFFISNINYLLHTDFNLKHLLLPLGISFFTFQQLSYVIDCYKNTADEYPFVDYALFVTFFPQLIAGPIVLHSETIPQFNNKENHRFKPSNMNKGLYAFSLGMAKKVLVADTLGLLVNDGFANIQGLGTIMAMIVMLSYTLQIYFDFSGYCDMAYGLGLMFNIEIPMNFNSPYKAIDIQDFWRRWHITLSRFLTTYIYIPLGGSRKGKLRTYINTMIVFFISGLWHGANYTFIIWGLMHGIAMCINRFIKPHARNVPSFIKWFINFVFINITWIFFRVDTLNDAWLFIRELFNPIKHVDVTMLSNLVREEFTYIQKIFNISVYNGYNAIILTIFIFLTLMLVVLSFSNTNKLTKNFKPTIYNLILIVLLLVWTITSFAGVSTFLYFNF